MDNRDSDYEQIHKDLNSKDANMRKQARVAKNMIDSESRETRGLRDELVEAHRRRERGKIEELHHKIIEANPERYHGDTRRYHGR